MAFEALALSRIRGIEQALLGSGAGGGPEAQEHNLVYEARPALSARIYRESATRFKFQVVGLNKARALSRGARTISMKDGLLVLGWAQF